MSDCCAPGGFTGSADPGRTHAHEQSCLHHGGGLTEPAADDTRKRIALIGSPNAGKTSIFNGLTGLRLKTGNYPGVTVTRSVGRMTVRPASPEPTATGAEADAGADADADAVAPTRTKIKHAHQHAYLEDLPGTYSLTPISPDEQVVADLLNDNLPGVERPDAALVIADVTVLERSLALIGETMNLGIPVAVALTMSDEMERRGGHVDAAALEQALGVPVRAVIGTKSSTLAPVRELLADPDAWLQPPVPPPAVPGAERADWVRSTLTAANYHPPRRHSKTTAIDRLLLHPLLGTLIFLAVMFGFFQVIFTVAAPLQGYIEEFFGWLGGLVAEHVSPPLLADFLGTALIGGVGGILVFVPQIMLMFLLISLLESVGYMSRAAFLTDRVMSRAGLEGRAFVAMLSSFACAVPGIMAARTLPSSRDRIAVAVTAPLMTCSARIPV
ncbi:MAG: ferrous iron transporter B, partial [Gordonia sp. (in: high G+C Gram-positive bacteria)]|uniref:FeoB small GTPase domain-containing protein n=1 Tax=Gordonia sp. (in: high G+C Gram-positive bacteria) TaxID=84139 RepID=UPI003BB55CBE